MSSQPAPNDARTIAHALRGVATAIETVCRNRGYQLSALDIEMIGDLTMLFRQHAADLGALAAREPDDAA